ADDWALIGSTENTSWSGAAGDVTYDNTASGLAADNVQDAIDEIANAVGAGTAPVVYLSGTTYALSDLTNGSWHVFTAAGLVTVNVPLAGAGANAEFGLDASGTAGLVVAPASGVTIHAPKGGTLTLEEGDFAVLKRRALNDYKLVGSTED